MLGHKLTQQMGRKFDVFATIRGNAKKYGFCPVFENVKLIENLDVNEINLVRSVFHEVKPDIAINCVGIIKSVPSAKNTITNIKINALLPHELANLADEVDAKLISIGTDCVFDGKKGNYTETDFPNAQDVYGKSKHLGEVVDGKHLTLRTSIIGREIDTSYSLIEWFLSKRGQTVDGFVNAIYSGFPTVVFADIISDLILNHKDLCGLFHVSSEPISKYKLLQLVKEHFELDIEIKPTEEFRIDRSLDSTKFRKAVGFVPKDWEEMIREMAKDAVQYENWR